MCCDEYYEIADFTFRIAKDDGEKYYYIVNNRYDTPMDLSCLLIDPNKNFRSRENAIKYLNTALKRLAKQILKELNEK